MNKPILFVVSGASGSGKGTVIDQLIHKYNGSIAYSVSVTTRDKRENEQEGISYFFRTPEQFKKMIANNEFLEYDNSYVNRSYGTPKAYVDKLLSEGKSVALDITIPGADNVKRLYENSVSVFLMPPSIEELRKRLYGRHRDTAEEIEERIKFAMENEFPAYGKFDYLVINDALPKTVEDLAVIFDASTGNEEAKKAAEKMKTANYTEFMKTFIKI